jgi:hypothetical protein
LHQRGRAFTVFHYCFDFGTVAGPTLAPSSSRQARGLMHTGGAWAWPACRWSSASSSSTRPPGTAALA